MPTYKFEVRFKSDDNKALVTETLENIFADQGFEIRSSKLVETARPGRKEDSHATKRVKMWVNRRNSPFEAKTFEDFTGLSKASAWRRLDRLVQAGVYNKRMLPDGRMEYYRPTV